MGAHAAVSVTVEGGCIAAGPTITFAGDEIDERGFLGLLHGSLTLVGGQESGVTRPGRDVASRCLAGFFGVYGRRLRAPRGSSGLGAPIWRQGLDTAGVGGTNSGTGLSPETKYSPSAPSS
jgi:hypothetical protein